MFTDVTVLGTRALDWLFQAQFGDPKIRILESSMVSGNASRSLVEIQMENYSPNYSRSRMLEIIKSSYQPEKVGECLDN